VTKPVDSILSVSSTVRFQLAAWAAYAACAWAFLFAALSFFWAAGGRTGLHPLELGVASNNFIWIIINLGAGIMKVLIGLLALALVQPWGRIVPRKLLRACVWVLGIGMFLYGALGLISDVLHVTGIINDPASAKWFFWYLVLWDPWWILGGMLYIAVAWFTRRTPLHIKRSDESKTGADR
jgi:uncharacterized protein DUF3995